MMTKKLPTITDVYGVEYEPEIVGHRLLIEVDPVTEQGAIVLPDSMKDKEQLGQAFGTILAVGEMSWLDLGNREVHRKLGTSVEVCKEGKPWAKVGDRILFSRFSGLRIWNPQKGEFRDDLMILNDKDIVAVLHKVSKEEKVDG